MTPKIKIHYLGKKHLANKAKSFLSQYHKSKDLPIPIEEITELKLGIRIIPIQNLKNFLGVESYLSLGGKSPSICIDSYSYENFENRTRFTCAHELGHYILHRTIYEKLNIKDLEAFKDFQNSLTPKNVKRLEIQAHIFAGYVLMPQEQFKKVTNKLIDEAGG